MKSMHAVFCNAAHAYKRSQICTGRKKDTCDFLRELVPIFKRVRENMSLPLVFLSALADIFEVYTRLDVCALFDFEIGSVMRT